MQWEPEALELDGCCWRGQRQLLGQWAGAVTPRVRGRTTIACRVLPFWRGLEPGHGPDEAVMRQNRWGGRGGRAGAVQAHRGPPPLSINTLEINAGQGEE